MNTLRFHSNIFKLCGILCALYNFIYVQISKQPKKKNFSNIWAAFEHVTKVLCRTMTSWQISASIIISCHSWMRFNLFYAFFHAHYRNRSDIMYKRRSRPTFHRTASMFTSLHNYIVIFISYECNFAWVAPKFKENGSTRQVGQFLEISYNHKI